MTKSGALLSTGVATVGVEVSGSAGVALVTRGFCLGASEGAVLGRLADFFVGTDLLTSMYENKNNSTQECKNPYIRLTLQSI